MSELQDTLNQIMSDPEAMRRVQRLGEQLGLSQSQSTPSPPVPPPVPPDGNAELLSAIGKLAPLMNAAPQNDEAAALLNALQPFLSGEKQERLRHAQRLVRLIRLIPLIKESGIF